MLSPLLKYPNLSYIFVLSKSDVFMSCCIALWWGDVHVPTSAPRLSVRLHDSFEEIHPKGREWKGQRCSVAAATRRDERDGVGWAVEFSVRPSMSVHSFFKRITCIAVRTPDPAQPIPIGPITAISELAPNCELTSPRRPPKSRASVTR